MELEIGLTLLLLLLLSLLATVDMAFGQLSDVGLRRLIGENGENGKGQIFTDSPVCGHNQLFKRCQPLRFC